MKRYIADFEVVDGQTGHRYMPGEIIVLDETDAKWRDVLPSLTEINKDGAPVSESVAASTTEREDVVIPSPIADVKQDSKPRA